jgi:hypothetical protein
LSCPATGKFSLIAAKLIRLVKVFSPHYRNTRYLSFVLLLKIFIFIV